MKPEIQNKMKNNWSKFWMSIGLLPLLVAFTPSASPIHTQDKVRVVEPCSTSNDAFVSGEEIVYKLYYNWNFVWLSAGEVTFRVAEEGNNYHLSARGRTYKSYEWFFKVRDNFDSYISKQTLLPSLSIREVHEGNYERYDKVVFDQSRHKAVSTRGRTRAEATPENFNLDGCMHDILSIVYYMRNLDFEGMQPGAEIPVKFFLDRETYPLKVKYLGAEADTRVKGMGRYRTHRFSPQLIAGEVFKEGDEMTVYVSQDSNKIPVLIESPVSVGSVKAVLKSYKGLKHDFTAKVD
jgi:hypothetical protein